MTFRANVSTRDEAPSRLVHVSPSNSWGGAELYLVQLAHWQKSAEVDVTIWCKKNSPIHSEALRLGVPVITDFLPVRQLLWTLPYLAKTIKREKFTHLQIHWSGGVVTFAGIKCFLPLTVFYHPHMFISYRKKDIFHQWIYQQLDLVFAAGPRSRDSYLLNLPLKNDQIKIIHYGLDLSKMSMEISTGANLAKWGLTPGKFYAGFFGRIDYQKGTKEFLLAAIPLLSVYPQLHLLLVGSPTRNESSSIKYQRELLEIIQNSKEAHRILCLGHQREYISLLSCLDVLVMPSYEETYSLLIISAFSLGIPVLSTNSGGTPDLIGAGEERGWLVPPRTVAPLKEKLEYLIRNPSKILEKKARCKEYAYLEHDHHVVIKQFLDVYKNFSFR